MLSIAPPPTIYLHAGATDMRKSFDGLSGIIRGSFGGDPADGSLFLYVNKRRDRLKALWWDGDGFALWYKRLEQGTFESVGGYERRKPGTEKPRSEALPAHLPRSEVKLPVPADLKECAPQGV